MAFVTSYLTVPILSYLICRMAGISLFKISASSVFFYSYLVFSYLGILPLYFMLDPLRVSMEVTNPEVITSLFLYSSLTLILVVTGFFVASRVNSLRPMNKRTCTKHLTTPTLCAVFLTLAVSTAISALYLSKLNAIPLLSAISEGASIAKIHRSSATNNFDGHYYRYGIFMDTIVPFCTYILFSHFLVKKNLFTFLIFVMTFSLSAFLAMALAIKSKLVFLILGLFFTYLLTTNKKISLRSALPISMSSLLILVFAYKIFMGMQNRPLSTVFYSIASRTFTGQLTPAYFYLEMFPRIQDYLWGRSFPNPGGIFPWKHYRLPVEVMNYMNPSLAAKGIVGSAPAAFWAELVANFGPLAPVIVAPIVGFFIFAVHGIISRISATPVSTALLAWVSITTIGLTTGGISSYTFNLNIYSIIALSFFLLFIEGRGTIKIFRPVKDN